MRRVFGHYVPSPLLVRTAAESTVVFSSVFLGFALPLVGIPGFRPAWGDTLAGAAALTALVLVTSHVAGLYDTRQVYGWGERLVRLATAFASAYLLIAVLGYLVPTFALSRKAFALSGVTGFPVVLMIRVLFDRLTANTRSRHKVLVLGSGTIAGTVAQIVREAAHSYELVGCLEADGTARSREPGLRVLGTIDDLGWISKVVQPDMIVVALEERRGRLPVAEIVECKLRGIEVDDWPTFYEKLTGRIPLSDLRPSWLVFADGFRPTRLTLLVKRAFDLAAALAGLTIAGPLMLLVAVAIRLDSSGPALFRQERIGQFGNVFSVFKFRSMRVDAPRLPPPAPGERDRRVTRVGAILRRTRFDELPQLINVLTGEMSLVGPRPEWTALVPEFREKVPLYMHRLAAKPGITGWAQVKNPYGATLDNTWDKLQYDLYYIKNMSIFLDLLIVLHTIHIVLFTRGSGEWNNKKPRSTTYASSAA